MRHCWSSEPAERGTFQEIEDQLTSMLAGEFEDLACHRYYQFVPIRDTEIRGVIKDCGLRSTMEAEESVCSIADLDENSDENYIRTTIQRRRRFSH